jgi:hypothetical protein
MATVEKRTDNGDIVTHVMGSGGVCFFFFEILESGVRRSVLFWCVWQESGFCRRKDVLNLI